MKRKLAILSGLMLFAWVVLIAVWPFLPQSLAGVIQAIIPQAVPTPNKRGTATVFQLATNTSSATAGTPFCDDGSGNSTTVGCTGGGSVPAGSSIFNSTSSATDTGTSPTSLIGGGAATIPANTLITQDPLSTFFGGVYTIPGAYAGTLTIQLLIAGSSVASSGTITLPAAAVTNGAWRLSCQITVRTTGSSGTAIYSCPLELIGSSLTSLTPAEASLSNTTTFSINTTISNTIDVQATWSTALGSPSITGQYATGFIGGAPVISVNGSTGAIATTSVGTFAGLPSCASTNTGNLYLFSNSIYTMAQCNGSAWSYYGPGGALTPPVSANFGTVVNSPTTVTTNGGIQITASAHSGDLYRMLCKNLPTAPYTIDASFSSPNPATQYLPVALALYDGTHLVVIAEYTDCLGSNPCTGSSSTTAQAASGIKTAKLNSTSSFNAYYNSNTIGSGTQHGPQLTLRLADDSTNRIMSYATDCCNFQAVTTVGNTDFMTPTQVCLAVDSNNTTFPSTAWFYHYREH